MALLPWLSWSKLKRLVLALLILTPVAVFGLWGAGVLALSPALDQPSLRVPASAFYALLTLVALWSVFLRRIVFTVWCLSSMIVLVLWTGIEPALDRNWLPDVAELPWAEQNGNHIIVHNIRDFEYRSEFDYSPRYISKTFDLSKLSAVDVSTTYWAGKDIAHTIVSFGFDESNFIAFSIETRKEQGEAYSTVNGFFRQYELIYIAATERDVLGLRTTYRHDPPEQVYLWRTKARPENARKLFLSYVEKINKLRSKPEFYNTLLTNCTNQIFVHVRTFAPISPFHWKILLSGHLPEFLDELGTLKNKNIPLRDRAKLGLINDRSDPTLSDEEYSQKIREPFRKFDAVESLQINND